MATKKETDNNDNYGYYVIDENHISPTTTGYPHGQMWATPQGVTNHQINPVDHFKRKKGIEPDMLQITEDMFLFNAKDHFIRDYNDNSIDVETISMTRSTNEADGVSSGTNATTFVFSGSVTNVNPFNDPEKESMMQPNGFRKHDIDTHPYGLNSNLEATSLRVDAPLSPLQPFYSLHPATANNAVMNYYNRTKLPIMDAEWRKGFRHIFISRPECYIMAHGNTLSEQCSNDEDFYSAFTRVPHILNLLSPVYVTKAFGNGDIPYCNWNFLLSNRVQGLSTSAMSLTFDEQSPKSIDGYTITPGRLLEGEQGNSLELTFRDLRTLDVYETLRLWMLYIYKCHKGIFAPSFNGYQPKNGFIQGLDKSGVGTKMTKTQYTQMHPYDRALDYCASLFDIVTNESGNRILYWCKYYGIYPVSASPSLSNDTNSPITEMTVSATFRYQKKKEFSNHNLVEFNYNAGICDEMGSLRSDLKNSITNSLPFMVRENPTNPRMNYIGASELFTGSPYIVLEQLNGAVIPQLRFIQQHNYQLDMGFYQENKEPALVAGY